jgi:hypothetical protein
MTRRTFFPLAALAAALSLVPACRTARPQTKPKLVVGIVIDQFRYDYLTRFAGEYTSGLALLLRRGAVFTNARYEHYPTVTAVGHSIILSGAMPSVSGIVGNEWFDRAANRQVSSAGDDSAALLGAPGPGRSPHRLLVSTLGDEMKMASRGRCRVIGVSLKDRAAILPSGHMADGAYWFDPASGNFVSSTFYFRALPEWVQAFNRSRPAGVSPMELEASPRGNDLLEAFAERAIDAGRLGRHAAPDLLTVSFSANDFVGHHAGPDSAAVRDISLATDRTIGRLLEFLDRRLGIENVLVVLTADHGVAPLPEFLAAHRMPGGRLPDRVIVEAIQAALAARFGKGDWIEAAIGGDFYLNRGLARQKKLDEAQVEAVAAEAAAGVPHVFRVFTRTQLKNGEGSRAVLNGFFPSRSGDLMIVDEPYWIDSAKGTTHGSPFGYDTHVPVIFFGPWIRPGRYDETIAPNDIAPTLATLLAVETPCGSSGRVLTEMLTR